MPKQSSDLGKRVARLREPAGISARKLSLAIGASHGVIAQLESGDIVNLRGQLLLTLARALGTSPEFLLLGEGDEGLSKERVAKTKAAFEQFEATREAAKKPRRRPQKAAA